MKEHDRYRHRQLLAEVERLKAERDEWQSKATHMVTHYRIVNDELKEARAEATQLRDTLRVAGNRLRSCGEQLTEFCYQEMASVLLDLPVEQPSCSTPLVTEAKDGH